MSQVVDMIMFDFASQKYVASVAEDGAMRIRRRVKNGWEKVRPSEVVPAVINKVDVILTRRLEQAERAA